MQIQDLPEIVRKQAIVAGATAWLEELEALVVELERDWSISVGRPYTGGTEAFVAEAIWEWGVVERVSTGLLCTEIDMQPAARELLAVADRVSAA